MPLSLPKQASIDLRRSSQSTGKCEATLLGEADLVVTVSQRAHRSGPPETERVPLSRSRTASNQHGSATSRISELSPPLVFLGHPKPWHGADRLPRLLADLAAAGTTLRQPSWVEATGADAVMERARELRIEQQITVTGPLPPQDASAQLCRDAIGLAPYHRQEPFYFCPLKIVDYLAAGLPVVSTAKAISPRSSAMPVWSSTPTMRTR